MSKQTHRRNELAPATVSARRVVIVAVSVLVFLSISMGAMALAFFTMVPDRRAPVAREFPQPQLQPHPSNDLQRMLAGQRAELNGYRWVDAEHTLVAIPIKRAMQIVAQRGVKGYDPIATAGPAAPAFSGAQP